MNCTGSRVEQTDKPLAEPFKHADALKAAQTDSARIDQLMADAADRKNRHSKNPRPKSTPRMEDRRSRVVGHGCPRFGGPPALPGVPAVPGECLAGATPQSE